MFRVGVASLRVEQPSGLSGTSRRLAQPLILPHYPVDLNPRMRQEDPCLRLHLLCAFTPGQNVVGLVHPVLRLTASYGNPLPPHNPIDP